jgi:hypothetical protein
VVFDTNPTTAHRKEPLHEESIPSDRTRQDERCRPSLQAAYGQPTYPEAKAALQRLRRELTLLNSSAAASLEEGLEETLTLHRLPETLVLGAGPPQLEGGASTDS